jgi:hypothetical protein
VRQRGGGQQAAQEVERLGLDRAPAGRRVVARELLLDPRGHARQRGGVGVEDRVHRVLVVGAELGIAVVAVAAARHRRVVGDVARRLLEVGGQPRALEHLREHVGDPLARDVGAAQLGHRVVAVAEEDALVELGGAAALGALPDVSLRC